MSSWCGTYAQGQFYLYFVLYLHGWCLFDMDTFIIKFRLDDLVNSAILRCACGAINSVFLRCWKCN